MATKWFLKNCNGFSLMEIIVALILIAVIVGLAAPRYTLTIERSKTGEGLEILQALHNAQKIYEFENGVFANNITDLDVEIPQPIHFNTITDSSVNSSNPIATVTRSDGTYSLKINNTGTLSCTPTTSSTCKMLGY